MTTFYAVVRRSGGWLPVIGLTSLIGTLSMLALPIVLGRAVDALIAGDGSSQWLWLAVTAVIISVLVDLVGIFAGTVCVAGTTAWLRNRFVRHVLAVGPSGSRRFDTGDLISRISVNTTAAAQAGVSVITAGAAALPPVGALIMLAYIDLWVAGVFLAGVVLVALVLRTFTQRTTELVTDYQRTQGRIAARLGESLAGARTIAAAGTVEREQRRVLEELPDLHGQGQRTWRVLSNSVAQAAVVSPLVLVAVLAVGGLAVVDGRMSVGELLAASQYAVIGAGLGRLTGVFGRLARARAGVRRIDEVLTVAPVKYGWRALPEAPGLLEFHKVTVRSDGVTLLDGVNLALPGGAAVAVVGYSGAGKSVLAALAARLRDPDEGQVLLDGVALTELSHQALRTAIGVAFERPVLVGATVADAMSMGRAGDWVQLAARSTHAHDFVSRLPRGYHTLLADTPMSGGEAQRLGLARAWHAERLLVLDDATSSLDMVTEMQISSTLTGDHGRRTRLIVTHRVATAARADLVVWLEGGRVRAVGPHEDLWADPAYRKVFG